MTKEITNYAFLSGKVISRPYRAFKKKDTWYCCFTLRCQRLSERVDDIPVYMEEGMPLLLGEKVLVKGGVRTYSRNCTVGRKSLVYIMATSVRTEDEINGGLPLDFNEIFVQGTICKIAGSRTTPLGRTITEMIVAINHLDGRSSYVPCVTWGTTARMAEEMSVGEKVQLRGRFQSREYWKVYGDVAERKVAYELSVAELMPILDMREVS